MSGSLCFLFDRLRTAVLILLHSSSNHFSLVFFGFLFDDFFRLHMDADWWNISVMSFSARFMPTLFCGYVLIVNLSNNSLIV